MRIVGGKHRGLHLASPKGRRVRPTAQRVREAIFSILGSDLSEYSVLDLFAGSGAMALEALSRGASFVVMVDQHPAALRLIGRNLATCGNPQNAKVYRLDLRRGLKGLIRHGYRFDVVFLDPPYGRGLNPRCLEQLGKGELLNPSARVVSEHAIEDKLTAAYGCLQRQTVRRYGSTAVSFYQRGE